MPNILAGTPGDVASAIRKLEIFMEDDDLPEEKSELYLRVASGEIRAFTGNLFDLVEGDLVTVDGPGTASIILPQAPVLAVNALVENPGRSTEVELVEDDHFEWSDRGILRRIDGRYFSSRLRAYSIDYDHGFAVYPDEVEGLCLRIASRAFDAPGGVAQETLGRYSYTTAGAENAIGLYPADKDSVSAYCLGDGKRMFTGASSSSS